MKSAFLDLAHQALEHVKARQSAWKVEDIAHELLILIRRSERQEEALQELAWRVSAVADGVDSGIKSSVAQQQLLFTEDELEATIRLGKDRMPKRLLTWDDTVRHLDGLRSRAKKIEASADREELKAEKLRPYMARGMNYGDAVRAYWDDHPDERPEGR